MSKLRKLCEAKRIARKQSIPKDSKESSENNEISSESNESQLELTSSHNVLAKVRRSYNVREEFICSIYSHICGILRPSWRSSVSRQTEFQYDSQSATSDSKMDPLEFIGNDELAEQENAGPSNDTWKITEPDEYVAIEFPNGNKYNGRVSRREMEGKGLYRWRSGEMYEGQFEQNMIEGKGYFKWNDQSWYEGEFHDGYRHGIGRLVLTKYGIHYIGGWFMGRKHGKGYCRYAENDTYEGEWNMDKKNGTGTRVYGNGARYHGEWVNDDRDGVGTMIWPNGDVYRGEWKNGSMNGHGEYVWNGFFNKTLSWPVENSYMGNWLSGMRHGEGVLKLNSDGGARYSGNWYMDQKHGHGRIVGNNGSVIEGDPLFLNDILQPSCADRSNSPEKNIECYEKSANDYDQPVHINRKKLMSPRVVPILEPSQFPPVKFHINRLFEHQRSQRFLSTETILIGGLIDHRSSQDDHNDLSEFCYEERWIYNCLTTHIVRLRTIYKCYAELYLSQEKPKNCNFSMTRLTLWQLWRDCGVTSRGISLMSLDNYMATNESALIVDEHYPFERIEFWQFIHALIELSWHLYTVKNNIETCSVRGRLAGGLYKFLTIDIFPNAGKHVGFIVTADRDLFPLHSVHRLYRELGVHPTAKQLLRVTCSSDPRSLSSSKLGTTSGFRGVNAVTIGEKLSYIPLSDKSVLLRDSKFASDLSAFKVLGATKMVKIMTDVCPAIRDKENNMIVDMEYELTFLEFCDILFQAARLAIQQGKMTELIQIQTTNGVEHQIAPTNDRNTSSVLLIRRSSKTKKKHRVKK